MAGKCLPLGLCKETVKESIMYLSSNPNLPPATGHMPNWGQLSYLLLIQPMTSIDLKEVHMVLARKMSSGCASKNFTSAKQHFTWNSYENVCILICLWFFNVDLTHWGRVTYIWGGNLTIIGSDNGPVPGRHPAIIWTNAGILLIGPKGTNFSDILIKIRTFS